MIVSFREDEEGRKFPYIDFGDPILRLWISSRLVQKRVIKDELTPMEKLFGKTEPDPPRTEYHVDFPVHNAKVVKTAKGSLVLRPAEGWMTYHIFEKCGYRGDTWLRILEPEEYEKHEYQEFHSPRGRLGISEGMLVCVPEGKTLKYKYRLSGRLYGASPEGVVIITPDGERKEIDWLPDGLEAIEELPVMEVDQ